MSDQTETLSRNAPCPCGSGRKYKRCCGVGAAPKLSVAKDLPEGQKEFMDLYNSMDPGVRKEMMQSLRQMPKGKLQKLQSLSRRMMSGEDVSSDLKDIQSLFPPEFQQKLMGMNQAPSMSEEEARALVAEAAAAGKISPEQAAKLLKETDTSATPEKAPVSEKSVSKFFKNLMGAKSEKS